MSDRRIVALGATMTADDVAAVAYGDADIECPAPARLALQRAHEFVREVASRGSAVYGLTTGCGPLAALPIAAAQREEFQRNLLRSHANTLGGEHSSALVRAAMLLRAQVFAQGCSGVDPALVELILALLQRRIHPRVRQIGGVGASGDLVELAQMGLVLIGEGQVEFGGQVMPTAQAFAAAQLAPIRPLLREGLALINGTCFHTAAAALQVTRARRLLDAAVATAAMAFEALGGHVEAYDEALHGLRPHPGQQRLAAQVRRQVAGSKLVRAVEAVAGAQDAYSLRCIPQILGPVAETIDQVCMVVEREINSVTDNPIFLVDEKRVVHGGNFHGQPVAMALDQLKCGLVEIGVASERRLARLLDASLSRGLPPFLVADANRAGFESGFMGLQYCATTMAAENAILSAPASVRSIPTNANNQDVVSMGMLAARQTEQVLDNVTRMVAIELVCAAQAIELRGGRCGDGSAVLLSHLRRHVAPLRSDRPLAADVERAGELIEQGLP